MNYRLKQITDRDGKTDWYRLVPENQTTLTQPVDSDAITIPVDDVSVFTEGMDAPLTTRVFRQATAIATVSITATSDGETAVITLPDYWSGNTVTVTVDSAPWPDFVVTGNQLTFTLVPPDTSVIQIEVTLDSLRIPLLSSDPRVFVGTTELGPGDFTVDGDRLRFNTPLSLGDVVTVTVEYTQGGTAEAWIGNERIRFHGVDIEGSRLMQCERGREGTAAQAHSANTPVWDASDRHRLRAVAESPGSPFSQDDLDKAEWPDTVWNWLSSE